MLLNDLVSNLYIDYRGDTLRVVQGRPVDRHLAFTVDKYGLLRFNKADGVDKARQLKTFLQKKKIKTRSVTVGLSHSGIIARNVRVPGMNAKDLDKMLKLNMEEYLPVNSDEYAFDYKVVAETEEEGQKILDIMIAAVKHQEVEVCASILEAAGLKPEAFDILPNMLLRILNPDINESQMLVDGGADGTRLIIFKGNILFMYADVPFYLTVENIAEFSSLTDEMRGYLDYFSSRNFGNSVDKIVILGELVTLPNLQQSLQDLFNISVVLGLEEQLAWIKFKGKSKNFSGKAPIYASNLGLMMRERI